MEILDSRILPEKENAPLVSRQPASAKWYDRRDYVFIEFCVEDSKDVNVKFEKAKLTFTCLGGNDSFKHLNEIDLYNSIDPNESKHKRTDRSVLCCLRKGESGQSWPRLTKEKAKIEIINTRELRYSGEGINEEKTSIPLVIYLEQWGKPNPVLCRRAFFNQQSGEELNWLSVDFNNWKDWEDDSDEDMSNFDRFSEKCQTWNKRN
ncbi:hypothetical protein Chor_012433 [Crotalus horridus]